MPSLRALISLCSQQVLHREALLAPHRSLTFGQLFDYIDHLGRTLRKNRIGRSTRAAVVVPNGPELAATFLGVAACAVCAPLNPAYRREEFEFYLSDLCAEAILLPANTESPAREVAQRLGLNILDLDISGQISTMTAALPSAPAEAETPLDWGEGDDIALVLHTSGTTSRPKQVPLSHRNLCASARNISGLLRLGPEDRCLNVMPLFHIHGLVAGVLASLAAGGSVVCARGFDAGNFARLMHDFGPTWYSAVPTIHQAVLALAKANPAIAAGRHLRLIRSSSAALPPPLMAELEETFGVPVIESYGMTEAAHQMGSNPLPPARRKPGSVGLPAGPEMAVMDDRGRILAPGQTGEIVIRGPTVTSEYVNNPEANRAAFTDGWFRTGDLGCQDDEGYFFITGRKKEMINRGGENISPREIDEVLLEHPAVAQSVAFAYPHPSLGEDVAAAVVLRAGMMLDEADLRSFASSRLVDFKVPSRILIVDSIPKGPTGKIQRVGMHHQFAQVLKPEYVAPEGPVESTLASMWIALLNVSRVGRNDNFFLRGGDSLLATRLVSRLRADLGVELTLPTLFEKPTLHAQAAAVDQAMKRAQEVEARETEAMLLELEGLSDTEAARLLAEEQQIPIAVSAKPQIPGFAAETAPSRAELP
jgi:acyl-CoA synthetase (AMP-forming)/AMP-acid ligase II